MSSGLALSLLDDLTSSWKSVDIDDINRLERTRDCRYTVVHLTRGTFLLARQPDYDTLQERLIRGRQFIEADRRGLDVVLKQSHVRDGTCHIDLWYPDTPNATVRRFQVGLMDVRAADDILVSYDKERDGWKIEQASTFSWDADDEECDPDWQEVAFIKAWAREKPGHDSNGH